MTRQEPPDLPSPRSIESVPPLGPAPRGTEMHVNKCKDSIFSDFWQPYRNTSQCFSGNAFPEAISHLRLLRDESYLCGTFFSQWRCYSSPCLRAQPARLSYYSTKDGPKNRYVSTCLLSECGCKYNYKKTVKMVSRGRQHFLEVKATISKCKSLGIQY